MSQREGAVGVGMPAMLKLQRFGGVICDAFGTLPYLVGSASERKDWRDVDVRLILSDADYERICGPLEHPHYLNDRWNAFCIAFASLGADMTGLPIDFQIDQQTEANEANNVHAIPFSVTGPDLVVSAPSAPASAILGVPFQVSYTVTVVHP